MDLKWGMGDSVVALSSVGVGGRDLRHFEAS